MIFMPVTPAERYALFWKPKVNGVKGSEALYRMGIWNRRTIRNRISPTCRRHLKNCKTCWQHKPHKNRKKAVTGRLNTFRLHTVLNYPLRTSRIPRTDFVLPIVGKNASPTREKNRKKEEPRLRVCASRLSTGDPDEIRTRVTAVKGRCLRPLDHRADGGCNWIRTNDTAGMNRML